MIPRKFRSDRLTEELTAAQDEKWRLAREMIRRGYSAERIAELIELPAIAVRIVKQSGDW